MRTKRTKRILSFMLVLAMVFGFMAPMRTIVRAESNTFVMGDGVTGTLSEDGKTLTVSGSGAITKGFFFLSSESSNDPYIELVSGLDANILDNIEKIVIENGITSIGKFAFTVNDVNGWYGLKNVHTIELPNTLQTVGFGSFRGLTKLKNVNFPDSITEVGEFAFGYTAIEKLTIGAGFTTITQGSFVAMGSLKEIVIPNTVEKIEEGAFEFAFVPSIDRKITIGTGVTEITQGAFGNGSSAAYKVTLITENEVAKNYDWAADNVTLVTNTVTPEVPSGSTTINGNPVNMEVSTVEAVKDSLPAAQKTEIEEVLTVINSGNTTAVAEMQKVLIKEVAKEEVAEIKYSKLIDVALPSSEAIPAGGSIQVTISDSNIKAGMNIVMLHLKADGSWENIPVTVVEGGIVGTFTSLSPVYYFEVKPVSAVSTSGTYAPAEIEFEAADGSAMRWISSDNDGNISISSTQKALPEGASFSATRVLTGDIYEKAAKAVASKIGNTDFAVYDMNVYDANGNALTKFSKNVIVGMPIPSGLTITEGKTVAVYSLNNGKLELCNAAIIDGFVNFETSHFSTYVYVVQDASKVYSTSVKSPKTAENNLFFYISFIAMLSFCGVVYGTRKMNNK